MKPKIILTIKTDRVTLQELQAFLKRQLKFIKENRAKLAGTFRARQF